MPSLPSRECGLKSVRNHDNATFKRVTPFAGVWIEIVDAMTKNEVLRSVVEKIVYDREEDELKVYYYHMP